MSACVAPSGVITLTTDFGHQDPFVGVMKGRILSRFREARIVDLTHEVVVHRPAEAGFWLARSFGWFPAGSVHVAVVDPGVGTARDILAVSAGGHLFLSPDNGLLAPVLTRRPDAVIVRLAADAAARLGVRVGAAAATFHGRDILAPLAAELAAGRCTPLALGAQVGSFVPSGIQDPVVRAGSVTGLVITIDHFGNLISNVDASLIEGWRLPVVEAGGHALPLRRTYGDVAPGEYLALINSFGVVEIARAQQSAARGLALGRGAAVRVRDSGAP